MGNSFSRGHLHFQNINFMRKSQKFILLFDEISMKDSALVGGKNGSLGEMYQQLTKLGMNVPDGFAISAYAYKYFIEKTGITKKINALLKRVDTSNLVNLEAISRTIRNLIEKQKMPADLEREIVAVYQKLSRKYSSQRYSAFSPRSSAATGVAVAVRSSATAEDMPGASFAGQGETFLNIKGDKNLIRAVKKCMSSLFTARSISYRVDKKIKHEKVLISVGIQIMVRSDRASSGVIFTIDTETGFDKAIIVNGSWGLGEIVVQGKVIPDEFIVFKPTLEQGYKAIISKELGKKNEKIVYKAGGGVKEIKTNNIEKSNFILNDSEILTLGKWAKLIEEHFSKTYGKYQPMDIEWAKDGKTGKLFIVQARPETVHSFQSHKIIETYVLKGKGRVIVSGQSIGTKIGSGKARIILDAKNIRQFKAGEVLITDMTDPDWEPIMKIASAIVTDKGGRTSHAAIVSRELGIPAIVGAVNATRKIKTGKEIIVDCSSGEIGRVMEGKIRFLIKKFKFHRFPKTKTKLMINLGNPDEAFSLANLPHRGVGLAREEFIIASYVKIHPQALCDWPKLPKDIKSKIDKLTVGFKDKKEFFIQNLVWGIAKIAAAFWPEEVIVRFSDFKTNEYRGLIGGELYEPPEENPMIGWRGASRYYDSKYQRAFLMEVEAIRRVRDVLGLKNVVPMVPFCRTIEEGKKVLGLIKKGGLDINFPRRSASGQRKSATKVYVMCEIPSNIILAKEFLNIFDGFSIGSNDLTQLTLGLDRDSAIVAHVGNEKNPAVLKSLAEVIKVARKMKKYSGICGQAPSDYPDIAEFLVKQGITSISVNPDVLIKTLLLVSKIERKSRNL